MLASSIRDIEVEVTEMACKWFYDAPGDEGNLDEGFCLLTPGIKCASLRNGGETPMKECEEYIRKV